MSLHFAKLAVLPLSSLVTWKLYILSLLQWLLSFLKIDLISPFIYLFERRRTGGVQRKKGIETLKKTVHSGAQHRAPSHEPEITTQDRTKSWTLEQLSHPHATRFNFFRLVLGS